MQGVTGLGWEGYGSIPLLRMKPQIKLKKLNYSAVRVGKGDDNVSGKPDIKEVDEGREGNSGLASQGRTNTAKWKR